MVEMEAAGAVERLYLWDDSVRMIFIMASKCGVNVRIECMEDWRKARRTCVIFVGWQKEHYKLRYLNGKKPTEKRNWGEGNKKDVRVYTLEKIKREKLRIMICELTHIQFICILRKILLVVS